MKNIFYLIEKLIIHIGCYGFLFIAFIVWLLLIVWPSNIEFQINYFTHNLLFNVIILLILFVFMGWLLMIIDLYKRKSTEIVEKNIWWKILLIDPTYGTLKYYNYIRCKSINIKPSVTCSLIANIKPNIKKVILNILYVIIISCSLLFILFYILWVILIFPYSDQLTKGLDIIWIASIVKLVATLGITYYIFYWIIITDRLKRNSIDLDNIMQGLSKIPHFIIRPKGIFQYYLKVLKPELTRDK